MMNVFGVPVDGEEAKILLHGLLTLITIQVALLVIAVSYGCRGKDLVEKILYYITIVLIYSLAAVTFLLRADLVAAGIALLFAVILTLIFVRIIDLKQE